MYMINIKKESVPISHQEDSQDKLNNFIFTWNFTFPDFFQTFKFSLTQSKIPWLITGFEVFIFPWIFLSCDSHALHYHAGNETLFLFNIASC